MTRFIISELRIHPIKGCKATILQSMEIGQTGPLNDRRLMCIDANSHFMNQKNFTRLAVIDVQAQGDEFVIEIPGANPLTLNANVQEGEVVQATIHGDTVDVAEVSQLASHLFSEFLETPCRLVAIPETRSRPIKEKYAITGNETVSFADEFPFLLISEASLDDLNSRLDMPVPMDRFRPNIVVSGLAPYEEDTWDTIQIGEIIFTLPKPCARCTVTTVDQNTGIKESERGKNPLKALAKYRNTEKGILFGQNVIHDRMGTLHVSQEIKVLTRKESPF